MASNSARQPSSLFECSATVLGSGSFSSVYKGRRISDNLPVAIKVFNPKVLPQAAREECELCERLMRLDIAGIVRFFYVACDISVPSFEIIMETLTGGELFERIVNKGILSERQAANITYNLIDTISQLHCKASIIHADIKPENIVFVDDRENSPFRLIDFGLSIHTSRHNVINGLIMKELVGTFGYMAPETYFDRIYSESADMWSVGVILYVLLSGSMPFDIDSKNFVKKLKLGQFYPTNGDMWANISSSAKDLVRKFLVADPKLRISSTDALDHPWFQSNKLGITCNTNNSNNSNSSDSSDSSTASTTPKSGGNSTFDDQYISRLKATTAKQRMRKVINGVIWTNRIQRSLLLKTLKESEDLDNDSISNNNNNNNNKAGDIEALAIISRSGTKRDQSFKEDSSPPNSKQIPPISATKSSKSSLVKTLSFKESAGDNVNASNSSSRSFRESSSPGPSERDVTVPLAMSLASLRSPDKKTEPNSPNFSRSFIPEVKQFFSDEIICLATNDIYRFKAIFESIINDASVSRVNFDQFCQACINIGLGDLAKDNIFELFDTSRSGLIEYREVLVALCVFQDDSDTSLRLYFDLFDKNSDGSLSMEEFQYVLGSCLSFLEPSSSSHHLNNTNTGENIDDTTDAISSMSLSGGGGGEGGGSGSVSGVLDSTPPSKTSLSSAETSGRGYIEKESEDKDFGRDCGHYRDVYSVFSEMDTNKDGFVDFEEFSRWMRVNFDSVRQNFRFNVKITE